MSRPVLTLSQSRFKVAGHDAKNKIVWIVDLDGPKSVTSDAEQVVKQLLHPSLYPGHRIIYRDTMGNWDELQHDGQSFTGFAPARDMQSPGVA